MLERGLIYVNSATDQPTDILKDGQSLTRQLTTDNRSAYDGFLSIRGKVCQKPAVGRGFHPGTGRFLPTTMMVAVVLLKYY